MLCSFSIRHYSDVIMSSKASQFTSIRIVYSTVYLGADHRKYQSSASLAFVRGIHRLPVNSPHKRPVTRKIFPFDDVIMRAINCNDVCYHRFMPDWMQKCGVCRERHHNANQFNVEMRPGDFHTRGFSINIKQQEMTFNVVRFLSTPSSNILFLRFAPPQGLSSGVLQGHHRFPKLP